MQTYPDQYGYPIGCAVDPASGNLAVTNAFGFSGAGQVLIFAGLGAADSSHQPQRGLILLLRRIRSARQPLG